MPQWRPTGEIAESSLVRILRIRFVSRDKLMISKSFNILFRKNFYDVINSSEKSNVIVFNCYLCHVRCLLIISAAPRKVKFLA